MTKYTFCMLCGERNPGDGHESSERHQLAGGRMAISWADNHRWCMWCEPSDADIRAHNAAAAVDIRKCKDPEHVENLRACREMVADNQPIHLVRRE